MTVVNRWMVFTVVGALGFAVQTLAFVLLRRAGVHYLPAVAMAVEMAVLHNFLCHERWTWRDRPAAHARERLARLASFHLANGVVSIVGNLAIVSVMVEALGAQVMAAAVVGMIVTGLVNFVGSDRLVFGRPRWLRALGLARVRPMAVAVTLAAVMGGGAEATGLQPPTIDAWNRYLQATEARIAREEAAHFRLREDRDAARILARLRADEVLVEKLETRDANGGVIAELESVTLSAGPSRLDWRRSRARSSTARPASRLTRRPWGFETA